MDDIIAWKYQMLQSKLNERQRRHWAGAEALALGYGGITKVANATGLSRTTITKGIKEIESNEHLADGRVRQPGGGRKKSSFKQSKLLSVADAKTAISVEGRMRRHWIIAGCWLVSSLIAFRTSAGRGKKTIA